MSPASAIAPSLQQLEPGPLAAQARRYASQAHAASTLRAYSSDWRDFCSWCADQCRPSLPASPETVALYLTAAAETRKINTLNRRAAAISQAHQLAGLDSPTWQIAVRKVMAGIRRAKGTAPLAKRPVVTAELRGMLRALDAGGPIPIRDRALLLLGFAGAFRRSELVAIDIADLSFRQDGLVVLLRRSKTDQEAQGREVGIPFGSRPETCPVRAVRAWISLLDDAAGPLFRPVNRHQAILAARLTPQSVALVVKRLAAKIGLDPALYAGHSLRAGLATAAAAAGVSERAIMDQTGHRSLTTVRRYIRSGSLFLDNAAAGVGL